MLHDLVKKNRSYRRFDEERRFSREELLALIDHARLAPSAMNLQPLRYRLVYSPEECGSLFPHTRWGGYLKDWSGPQPGERPAAYLLMCLPHNAGRMQFVDTGIAGQSILLAAAEQGWGGCMLGSVDKDEVHRIFSLPEELEIVLAIALGVPAEKIVLNEIGRQGGIEYWRDEAGIHHVPKRKLDELILSD
ncbi:MAG: nitroreductase family protein [Candidatus Cloacimonetes bacterium]|nr:nitroreductase family protein [Candidatus Cloacimonadota bacterium]